MKNDCTRAKKKKKEGRSWVGEELHHSPSFFFSLLHIHRERTVCVERKRNFIFSTSTCVSVLSGFSFSLNWGDAAWDRKKKKRFWEPWGKKKKDGGRRRRKGLMSWIAKCTEFPIRLHRREKGNVSHFSSLLPAPHVIPMLQRMILIFFTLTDTYTHIGRVAREERTISAPDSTSSTTHPSLFRSSSLDYTMCDGEYSSSLRLSLLHPNPSDCFSLLLFLAPVHWHSFLLSLSLFSPVLKKKKKKEENRCVLLCTSGKMYGEQTHSKSHSSPAVCVS